MTYEIKRAYTEVYQVLENMPKEYRNKIPQNILKLLETARIEGYKQEIEKENPIDSSKLSKQAMTILAILNYHYWCPNRKVKNDLYKVYAQNEEKVQKEIQQNLNDLFKSRKKDEFQNNRKVEDNFAMVKYKESIFIQIAKLIKKIGKRNRKKM